MSEVSKIIDVVGTSANSIEDAVQTALERTARTVSHLRWFEISEVRGFVENQKVAQYQVHLRIGFGIED